MVIYNRPVNVSYYFTTTYRHETPSNSLAHLGSFGCSPLRDGSLDWGRLLQSGKQHEKHRL